MQVEINKVIGKFIQVKVKKIILYVLDRYSMVAFIDTQ